MQSLCSPSRPASLTKSTAPQLRTGDFWLGFAGVLSSACFFLALIAYNFVDIDLWHQMALIRDSLAAGHLLRADVYAYTPTIRPWIDHEWGAGAIAYFGSAWLGSRIIVVLKWALALGTFLLCLATCSSRKADVRLFAACAPLAIFLMHLGFFSAVRAQAYTFFFAALLAFVWEKLEKGSTRWLFAWLAVFSLWVNLHGGFVVGIGLTALYCVEKLLRREHCKPTLLLLAGMLVETWLTPYGSSYFAYLRRALSMSRPYSAEWGAVSGLGPLWAVCFVAALLLAGHAVVKVGIRNTLGLLPLAATAAEAALHRKLLPLFAVLWLSYTPAYLQRTGIGNWTLVLIQRRRAFVMSAWIIVACASGVSAIRQRPWQLTVPQPIYPVGPVRYLADQHWHGHLLVPFRLGAYVTWKLYPAVKVALDSRYEEVFPDDVVKTVFDFYGAVPGWRKPLTALPTDLVLVPLDTPVANRMGDTGWVRVYHDQQFDLFASPQGRLPEVDWSALSFSGTLP
jgi:hypothetical protein